LKLIEESHRVVSPRPEHLYFAIDYFITINIMIGIWRMTCYK